MSGSLDKLSMTIHRFFKNMAPEPILPHLEFARTFGSGSKDREYVQCARAIAQLNQRCLTHASE